MASAGASTYVVAAVAAALWYYAVALLRRRRCKIPGPTGLPLVGYLPFLRPDLHAHFADLSASYGPVLSLSLGRKLAVVLSSPAAAREAFRDNDAVLANRDVPAAARVIAYGGADIVWTPYGPTWRMLRRLCVRELLSPASLDATYALRRRELRATVAHVRRGAGGPVDVGAQMFLNVMNVVTGAMWGGTLYGDEGRRTDVAKEIRQVVADITELLGTPNISDFFPALARFDLQGIERKMRQLKTRFDTIFAAIIQQRATANGGLAGKDFLDSMLKMEDEQSNSNHIIDDDKPTKLTMTHVKALLMDMVVGGTETTSNTVEWAMAEMMKNPAVMRRAQEEVDAVVGRESVVEESHLPRLEYINAVVKETLRLYPALPLLVPHCPSSHCTVGGHVIPAGSRVFVNVWAIHRDPAVWEDPLVFDPERFLKGGGWDYAGSDLRYFPFGSGRRVCAGIPMAERTVGYSLASLVHSFEWKMPPGAEVVDLSAKFGIVMKKAEPFVAIPTPRLAHPSLYT